jgi:hypothetical protein
MSASIKQLHAELAFEIGQGLAHHGLGTMQAPAGGGKTSLIGGGNEGAQLIQ